MTNAEARFNKSLRPQKPEGSLGRTAQDVHLDSHTAPELWGVFDDDVGLYVLGCRVDILGTNCTKLLKVKMSGGGRGGGERVALASVRVIMSGGQQGAYCCIKNTFCRWESVLLRIKNDDHLLTAVDGPVMRAAYIKNC